MTSIVDRQRDGGLDPRVVAISGVAASAALYAFFYLPRPGWDYNLGYWIGRDFVNFWAAGRLALLGKSQLLFDVPAYNQWLASQISGDLSGGFIYSYPPQLIPLLLPFGALPYGAALVLWTIANIAALAAALWFAGERRITLLLALAAPAVALGAFQGHLTSFLAALMMTALVQMDKRPILAGVCLGLMTVKPQLGMVLGLIVLIERRWQLIGAAIATAVALFVMSVALAGIDAWAGYINHTIPAQKQFLTDFTGGFTVFLATPFAALLGWGMAPAPAMILHACCALLAIAAAVFVRNRRPQHPASALLIAIASVIVTPYANLYDLALTVPWLAMILTATTSAPMSAAALVVWLIPAFGMPLAMAIGPIAGLVLLAMIVLIVREATGAAAQVDARSTFRDAA